MSSAIGPLDCAWMRVSDLTRIFHKNEPVPKHPIQTSLKICAQALLVGGIAYSFADAADWRQVAGVVAATAAAGLRVAAVEGYHRYYYNKIDDAIKSYKSKQATPAQFKIVSGKKLAEILYNSSLKMRSKILRTLNSAQFEKIKKHVDDLDLHLCLNDHMKFICEVDISEKERIALETETLTQLLEELNGGCLRESTTLMCKEIFGRLFDGIVSGFLVEEITVENVKNLGVYAKTMRLLDLEENCSYFRIANQIKD